MRIGLYNIDSKMPNIALMKLSAYHKAQGDQVNWYSPIEAALFDKVYASSIFTYSDKSYITDDIICGGSGFDLTTILPQEIDDSELDYTLYPDFKQAIGFLTRGCIRQCDFCIVSEKEGKIRPYRDIEQVARDRKEAILLDNNVLACDHGLKQIEKIIDMKLKVDFNQGLDARLIDNDIAKLLSKVRWLKPVHLACDSVAMIEPVRQAVELLRWYNCTPRRYAVYVMAKDLNSAIERVKYLKGINVDPFVQPFINKNGDEPPKILKDFTRFVNRSAIFHTTTWEQYNRCS